MKRKKAMHSDFEHLSRLTHKAALKVWDYADRYNLHIRGGFTYPERGDSLYFMINEPNVLAFVHCTPYCYLVK